MKNQKEIILIIITILIMGLVICYTNHQINLMFIPQSLIYSGVIIFASVLGKKISSRYFDVEASHEIFGFQRYGFSKKAHLKKSLKIGLILPLLISFISGGSIKLLTFLQTELKPLASRTTKRRGLKRYFELKESEISLIVFYGILSNIILAIIANILNHPILASYSLYYATWNLIPFGQLDGTKIFFGSRILYLISIILLTVSYLVILI